MESLLDQERQPAAVIDVSVAENYGIDPAGVEGQLGIQLPGFGSPALEHSCVQERASAGRFE